MHDLFAIACTTCKTRLRVRDAAVIGQILACPKCSSMVLVEPPEGWQPPIASVPTASVPTASVPTASVPTAAAASETASHSQPVTAPPNAAPPNAERSAVRKAATGPAVPADVPPPQRGRSTAAEVDPSSMRETVGDAEFGEVDALFANPASPQRAGAPPAAGSESAAKPLGSSASSAVAAAANVDAAGPPATAAPVPSASPPPASDWTPARVRRIRLLAMLAVTGCMGVALAIGAAVFVASWSGADDSPAVALNDPAATTPAAAENAAIAPPSEPEAPLSPDTETTAEPPPAANTAQEVAPTADDRPPAAEAPTVEPPAAPESSEPTPVGDDPLGLVNEQPPAPAENGKDPLKLDDLRKLSGLLPSDTPAGPPEASGVAVSADRVPPEEMSAEPEEPATRPRPERKKVDLPARLADRIAEIEFQGQPLEEAIRMLSNLSTIPITLDPEALIWSRITPGTPVKAKLTDTTVEGVLVEVLKPFRLELAMADEQVVVTRSPALRLIKCPVGDLTGGDAAQQQQLIAFFEQLAAPGSWKSAGGAGSMTPQGDVLLIENTELAYGEVMQVCERLRIARGSRPKSVFPAELFELELRSEQAAPRLATPITLNFSQPTLLATILDRLAKESGTTILVDWQAAADAGWSLEADATLTLKKTPLRDALAQLLKPMDLTYRVVDRTTLQVTTAKAIEQQPEIEVHPVGDLAATAEEAEPLIERLQSSLAGPAAAENESTAASVVLRYDEASKTLFALLPQPKQLRLAQLLDTLRAR
jgi:hypothetical protein